MLKYKDKNTPSPMGTKFLQQGRASFDINYIKSNGYYNYICPVLLQFKQSFLRISIHTVECGPADPYQCLSLMADNADYCNRGGYESYMCPWGCGYCFF